MVRGNLYGHKEHLYCEPFAEALVSNCAFRKWILERLGLVEFAVSAVCLKEEQRARRPNAKFWWKNYFCHEISCTCAGLAGREIDILAIFRDERGQTLGLHVECKRPGDRFSPKQAAGYRIRAECWGPYGRNPQRVLPYKLAKTLLICDRAAQHDEADVRAFDDVIYFDEIRSRILDFPIA